MDHGGGWRQRQRRRFVRSRKPPGEIKALATPEFDKKVFAAWNTLVASDRARLLPRASLVREAKRLLEARSIEAGRCPLCGQNVDEKVLARRIESALVEMMEATRDLERFRDPILEQADGLESAHDLRRGIHDRARAVALDIPPVPALPNAEPPGPGRRAGSRRHRSRLPPISRRCVAGTRRRPSWRDKSHHPNPARGTVSSLMLAALCQQINAWHQAEKKNARAGGRSAWLRRVFDAYQQKQKEDLGNLLQQISGRVATIYSALHPGEDLDAVSIEPWTAKGVELAINFYGSRQRPPHGVLSESHLNSLAIALFLAMAASFNEKLGFLILDDVINSFDVEHRGRLAELLADGFADWQLIVLTHDQQFFEHLSRRAPSWRKLEFTSWSHASGPRTTKYETSGMLAAARERLQSGDVQGAATKGRRALEELLQEVCEALWAPLPFRRGQANDRREIGELFIGLRRALKEHAKSLLDGRADVQASGSGRRRHVERRRPCQPWAPWSERGQGGARTHRDARSAVVVPVVPNACLAQGTPPRRAAAAAMASRSPPVSGLLVRLIGSRVGHYLVLDKLGRGAWGWCTSPRTRDSIAASRSSFSVRTSSKRVTV